MGGRRRRHSLVAAGEFEIARLRAAVAQVLAGVPEAVAAFPYGCSARGRPARGVGGRIAAACARPVVELAVRIVDDADPVFLGNPLRDGRRCHERDVDSRFAFEVLARNARREFGPAWERLRRRVLEVCSRG